MEIDIPQNAQELESVLCNLLFEKKGTSIELIGNKFTKKTGRDVQRSKVKTQWDAKKKKKKKK